MSIPGQANPGINMGAIRSSVSHANMLSEGNLGGASGSGEFGLDRSVAGVLAGQAPKGSLAGDIGESLTPSKSSILQVGDLKLVEGSKAVFSIIDGLTNSVRAMMPVEASAIGTLPVPVQGFVSSHKGQGHGAAPAA